MSVLLPHDSAFGRWQNSLAAKIEAEVRRYPEELWPDLVVEYGPLETTLDPQNSSLSAFGAASVRAKQWFWVRLLTEEEKAARQQAEDAQRQEQADAERLAEIRQFMEDGLYGEAIMPDIWFLLAQLDKAHERLEQMRAEQ